MSSASAPRTVDLSQAPLLRHLDISVVFESVMRFPPILKTCPQSHLTHLRISGAFEADSVVSIIANSPLLEDVVWSHVKRLEPGEWVTEGKYALKPVRLEHLRHLGLKGLAPLAFLSVVEAPNLVRLFLHYPLIVQGYVRRPREAFHKHHFAYLSKSIRFPRLRALDLAGQLDIWDIEYSSITAFLRAHPSLEAVKLPSQITESIADAILESLIHVRVIEALLRDRNDEGKCRTACLLDHWAQGDQDDVGKDASSARLPKRGPVPQRNRHFEYDPVELARWLRPSPLPILCLRGESSSTKDTRFPEFDRFGDYLVRFESWPFFAFASEDWDEFWRELDAHTLEG
ncbi:hypothetical protein DL93DRAFT_2100046 [Clavulina sp. PMI_390]|nr:hypothetical protein DL93DRAFT_2100046 [Clavulina sp. PMI_390]